MLLNTGALFWGRYATLTPSRIGVFPWLPVRPAFHWMYRALGLGILVPSAATSGSDQSRQVLSGRSEFPVRVRKEILPAAASSTRQLTRPHCATVPASCTGDSKEPELSSVSPSL